MELRVGRSARQWAAGFCLVRNERQEVGVRRTKAEGSKVAACQHSSLRILGASPLPCHRLAPAGRLHVSFLTTVYSARWIFLGAAISCT